MIPLHALETERLRLVPWRDELAREGMAPFKQKKAPESFAPPF